MKYLVSLAALAMAGSLGVGLVYGDQWDKKTIITIDQPMQMPAVTLQPGTYVFKLADLSSERHVVQIFNKDETHIIATMFAIPNERLTPTGKSVFTFWETPAGRPQALRAWFYPGDDFGQEFLYPKSEADQIAVTAKQQVPTTDDVPPAAQPENTSAATTPQPAETTQMQAAQVSEPQAAPSLTAAQAATQPESQSSSSVLAQAAPAPQAPSTSTSTSADSLPQTASNMLAIALIGLLSLFGFAGVSFVLARQR